MQCKLFILFFSLFTVVSCKINNGKAIAKTLNFNPYWKAHIEAQTNDIFDPHFTRYNYGWEVGDITYSILLNNSTNLPAFGDTYLGSVNDDRSRDQDPLIHNTFVLQNDEVFKTLFGGTLEKPEAFLIPPENDWWYSPGHEQIHKDIYSNAGKYRPRLVNVKA